MWAKLVRGTEWSTITDLASPSFFDVVPSKTLRHAARRLLERRRDKEGFRALRDARNRSLADAGLPLAVGPGEGAPPLDPEARGELVVALYFHQLWAGDRAILDLRPDRFAAANEHTAWDPKALWWIWDPAFLEGLREIYAGFYEDDDARFDAGLRALGVEVARDAFREQFGGGEQRAVRFTVSRFTAQFHEIFVRCREAGVALHGDFVPLGLYLATMVTHLEELDAPIDVRGAYERVRASA